MKYTLYEVGGKVRDEILGLDSKDVDYTVVIEENLELPIDEVFKLFVEHIKSEGYEVFLETESCLTVRAKFPKSHQFEGLVADFVIARKEIGYKKGTREPIVELGTLHDDLERRDFTVNAIAKDLDGNLIDPFNGQKDLKNGILKTPLDTAVSFNDDPLRVLRAIRFNITKGLEFSDDIWRTIGSFNFHKFYVVSDERIREELFKAFKYNTWNTLHLLQTISKINYMLYLAILPKTIWLEPTTKK